MIMNVGDLKQKLRDFPDNMPVYVACQGYTNYDSFDTRTFIIVKNGKLFIIDACTVEIDGENI